MTWTGTEHQAHGGSHIKREWLERNATTITALVLIGIGAVAYIGF